MHLFDEDWRYSNDALRIEKDALQFLDTLYKTYIAKGYSPREITHILMIAAVDIELELVLDKARTVKDETLRRES